MTDNTIPATKPTDHPLDIATISVLTDTGITKMDMNAYLTGVLLAEMPADFAVEALKAQAVVARTYALHRSLLDNKHLQGAVCTDAACCQAYRTTEDFLSNGGTAAHIEKVVSAVRATENEILLYDGTLIEATYFSCSGGRTEDALAVWGTDVPYLQAVDSPGEENSVHFTDSMQFSVEEFAALTGIPSQHLSTGKIGETTYTGGGGVASIVICGKTFTGIELRQKLGLKSTIFSILVVGQTVHVSTRGYGHRVGMSQYGAEAMAVKGSNYREILSHYYPGTYLSVYSHN